MLCLSDLIGKEQKSGKNRGRIKLAKYNCKVIYLPHTDGISSTLLREKINNK